MAGRKFIEMKEINSSMKRIAKDVDCKHQWEDLYVFKSTDGKKLVQQKCKKCQKSQYVDYEEPEKTK